MHASLPCSAALARQIHHPDTCHFLGNTEATRCVCGAGGGGGTLTNGGITTSVHTNTRTRCTRTLTKAANPATIKHVARPIKLLLALTDPPPLCRPPSPPPPPTSDQATQTTLNSKLVLAKWLGSAAPTQSPHCLGLVVPELPAPAPPQRLTRAPKTTTPRSLPRMRSVSACGGAHYDRGGGGVSGSEESRRTAACLGSCRGAERGRGGGEGGAA